jgi:hypothetical protein
MWRRSQLVIVTGGADGLPDGLWTRLFGKNICSPDPDDDLRRECLPRINPHRMRFVQQRPNCIFSFVNSEHCHSSVLVVSLPFWISNAEAT